MGYWTELTKEPPGEFWTELAKSPGAFIATFKLFQACGFDDAKFGAVLNEMLAELLINGRNYDAKAAIERAFSAPIPDDDLQAIYEVLIDAYLEQEVKHG